MYLTGFADEAAKGIDGQIKATRTLGWRNIEARVAGTANIHDIPDAEFDTVCAKLTEAGIRINCFGSTIANWGKKITDPFTTSLEEAKRAIPRMHRLGTKLVRIMSFAVLEGRWPDDQMEEERFNRLRELQKMFCDAGLTPVHENCMNYGGMGWKYTLKLIEKVPGLKLVFDTGNPVFSDDRSKSPPYPKQSAWEFYSHVKSHVAYVHVKDGTWDVKQKKVTYTMPGEGQGDVRRIMHDLIRRGYNGGISIEPHLSVVFHEGASQTKEEIMFSNYVEYGRRMEAMLKELGAKLE